MKLLFFLLLWFSFSYLAQAYWYIPFYIKEKMDTDNLAPLEGPVNPPEQIQQALVSDSYSKLYLPLQ